MNFDKIATDIVGRIICQPQNGAKLASLLSSVRLVELTVYALFIPAKCATSPKLPINAGR